MIEKRLVSLVCVINEEKKYSDVDMIMITISKPEIFFYRDINRSLELKLLTFYIHRLE